MAENSLEFTVDSQLLGELGERLVTRNYIALSELVKNAYDADATETIITFHKCEEGRVLSSLPDTNVENVFLTEEAEALAQNYIYNRVVTAKHIADAQHIAIASVERVDVLVSWNFQQIVNLDRIRAFNFVKLKSGYPILEIRSPREVIHEEEI